MKTKKIRYIILISFIIPIFSFGIYSLIDKDAVISNVENRELNKKPVFSTEKLFNSSYAQEYEAYYSDTFPFRDVFFEINKKINSLYYLSDNKGNTVVDNNFQMGIEDREIKDKDDGSPRPVRPKIDKGQKTNGIIMTENSAMEVFTYSKELIDYFAKNIEFFSEQMPGKNLYLMVPPSASEFYAPKDLMTDNSSEKRAFDYLSSLLKNVKYVDAYSKISKHAKEEYLYFRTDHHWTARGAYYGYTAFADALGVKPVSLDKYEYGHIEGFLGTMYKSTVKYDQSKELKNYPDYVEYFKPKQDIKAVSYKTPEMTDGQERKLVDENYSKNSNKYNVFLGGDAPILKISTNVDNNKTLVVVRDSYGHAIMPYLINHYKTIYAIEPRYFNDKDKPELKLKEFVDKVNAEDVLFMNYPMFISGGYWFKWIDVIIGLQ